MQAITKFYNTKWVTCLIDRGINETHWNLSAGTERNDKNLSQKFEQGTSRVQVREFTAHFQWYDEERNYYRLKYNTQMNRKFIQNRHIGYYISFDSLLSR